MLQDCMFNCGNCGASNSSARNLASTQCCTKRQGFPCGPNCLTSNIEIKSPCWYPAPCKAHCYDTPPRVRTERTFC